MLVEELQGGEGGSEFIIAVARGNLQKRQRGRGKNRELSRSAAGRGIEGEEGLWGLGKTRKSGKKTK